ncbi:unnamed protein product [Cunninghamella blakesleeana]
MQYKYILVILFLAAIAQAQETSPTSSVKPSSTGSHRISSAISSISSAISSHKGSATSSVNPASSSAGASASASATHTSAGTTLTYNVLPEVMVMALLFIASFLAVLA